MEKRSSSVAQGISEVGLETSQGLPGNLQLLGKVPFPLQVVQVQVVAGVARCNWSQQGCSSSLLLLWLSAKKTLHCLQTLINYMLIVVKFKKV